MGKPPILNFAYSRTTTSQGKPFFYDPTLNLNTIEIAGSLVPFVDVPTMPIPELYTKTEATREDDEEGAGLLELQTKTLAHREGDDDDYRLLELLTKTRAERESDDE
jgi:hypothetical protein